MGIETLNEDLELNIPMFDDDMNIIAQLDDEPNAAGGLTAAELKAEFDRPGKTIQEYLNKTLIPSLIGTVAEESVRAQNEYVRVANENQRIANEEAREKAEQAREDKTSGIVAQATEQAKKAEEQAKLAGQVKSIQAEAETVSAESDATAEVVEENGNLLLRMGIPRGKVGPQGPVGPRGPQGIPGNVDFDALTPEQLEMLKGERGPAGDPGVSPSISILPGERDEADGTVRYGTVIEVTNPDGSKVYAFVPDGRDGDPGPAGPAGAGGKDGVTFTPSVSSAGVLSWSNDGGKQNPSSVNIKGPAGPAGEPGDTPYIGANGNWWIGGTDTGVAATGSGSGGASVQADLGENDETKLSFVKNRTHWKEEFPGKDIILETTKTFGGNTVLSGAKGSLTDGEEYIVTWNGKEYACVCHGKYVGNKSLASGGGDDTGEPFYISNTSGTLYQIIKANSASESITFGVKTPTKVTWHKMDPGYLPDGVPYTEEGLVELLPETAMEIDPEIGQAILPVDPPELAVGETYIVTWNGTAYECVGQKFDTPMEDGSMIYVGVCLGDLGAMGGGDSTGEPFVLVVLDPSMVDAMGTTNMVMALDGSTSATMQIARKAEIDHPIPGKFMPEGTPWIERFDDGVLLEIDSNAPESNLDGGFLFGDRGFELKTGAFYNVYFNGELYECEARGTSGGWQLGRDGNISQTHIPFELNLLRDPMPVGDGRFAIGSIQVRDNESWTLSISGVGYTCGKLAESLLPSVHKRHIVRFVKSSNLWTPQDDIELAKSLFYGGTTVVGLLMTEAGRVERQFWATAMEAENLIFVGGDDAGKVVTYKWTSDGTFGKI